MHIVFVSTELATSNNSSGGLASFNANMARIFSQKGHKVTILLALVKPTDMVFDKDISLHITYIEKEIWEKFEKLAYYVTLFKKEKKDVTRKMFVNLYKSKQVKLALEEINKKDKIDIVHYSNHGALNLRANPAIPYVVRVSGFLNIWHGGANIPYGSLDYRDNPLTIKDKLEEYTVKKSKYVIFPSKLLAEIARENIGVNPTVLESPFNLKKSDWDHSVYNNMCQGKKYIIHYGSLRYMKGIHVVAQLSKKFLQQNPDMYIVLAGNSEMITDEFGNTMKAHELVIKNAGIYANRVFYVGRLVREQLYPFIQNAELCLLPSRIENLSNACIEAMAMGKIVVATNGASYEQVIEDRVSGFLCKRDDAESFLQGINEALTLEEEEKQKMRENAKKRVERLNPENVYRQYLEFYKKVIREW